MAAGDVDDDEVTRDVEAERPTQTPNEATTQTGRPKPRAASAALEVGERYRLGASIARGGMGEIVAAHDIQIGRDVAIKRLLTDEPTPIALARFLREARIQGRLEHPAIVPVHELAHDADGQPYFVMKKLSGTTLKEVLRDNDRGKFTRQRLLRAFADVCLAIEFAHTRGVIHRDIKPSNILLGDFGEVYVLDWGIARMDATQDSRDPGDGGDGTSTMAGTTLGTPGYMAPEQVLGLLDVDGRADIYALGCILFEILANVPLHPRGDAGMRSAVAGVVARPSRHAADPVPPELDRLCERATATDAADRLGSARELGEAVQRYLDGDRDLEQRTKLASEHLASATAALEAGNDEDHRRSAMRGAGQALALDPTLIPAAELVGRLMLEPPTEMPKPVQAELAAIDDVQSRYHARLGVATHFGYLMLAVVLALLGMHDGYIAALAAVSTINVLAAFAGTRGRTNAVLILVIFGNVASLVLFSRMFSPFLIAPGLAAVTVMAFAFHPIAALTVGELRDFLLSDKASFITGIAMPVDGGTLA